MLGFFKLTKIENGLKTAIYTIINNGIIIQENRQFFQIIGQS
jgi:hypothetical protein